MKEPRFLEIWTYEGPWCLHQADDINVLVMLAAQAHDRKQAGIKAHESQISRVPFHVGADALEKLRAISFSESHLGGRDPRGFDPNSRLECYARFVIGPDEQALAQYSQYSS